MTRQVTAMVPVDAQSSNRDVFAFLRRRVDFIADARGIEALVHWGPTVDTVARIHARRLSGKLGSTGNDFMRALHDLVHVIDLRTISVPLLVHELQRSALEGNTDASLLLAKTSSLILCLQAMHNKRIWTAADDLSETAAVRAAFDTLKSSKKKNSDVLKGMLSGASYAGVLYFDYRCSIVHGMELGWRVWPGDSSIAPWRRDDAPYYMNYSYYDNRRPVSCRYPTRIAFEHELLVRVLNEMIDQEEADCARAQWVVPSYATLKDKPPTLH